MQHVRSAYNYDRDLVSEETGLFCDAPSMAHQEFKEECDINEMVRQFGVTGTWPETFAAPQYGDYTKIGDFQTAMNAIGEAQKAFMVMPSKLRARFENDPQQLLEFVSKASNREEAIALGLVPAPAVVVPTASGVSPPASASKA